MGTGPVRGFAVALSLGIVTSVFTSIYVTRLLVIWWLKTKRRTEIPV
jgi:preprotein translocase subunit SecD